MDDAHKDILIQNRVKLIENINIEDGLLSQLLSKKVFKPRTLHKIQACKTPESQIECLLDTLPLTGSKSFDAFCDALTEEGQDFVVDLYLKPKTKETSSVDPEKEVSQQNATNVPRVSESSQTTLKGDPVRPNSSPPRIPSHHESSAVTSSISHQRELSPPKLTSAAQFDSSHALVPSHIHRNTLSTPNSSSSFITISNSHSSENDGQNPPNQPFMHPSKGAFHIYTNTTNSINNTNYSNNNVSEYTQMDKRYQMKHFIDDPQYQKPSLLPPKTVPIPSLAVPYPSNAVQGRQEIVYVTTSRVLPSNTGMYEEGRIHDLSRSDSLDAMTKPAYSQYEDNSDHSETPAVKRSRIEEVIKVPIFNFPKQPSEPSVIVQGEVQSAGSAAIHIVGNLDDPEVDSTDGSVAVRVDLCSRQFYLSNYKNAYSMRKIPRGKALIINVNEVEGKPARRGTDIDRDNLRNLLTQLHFDVTVYNDCDGLTAQEMAVKLQNFASDPDHKLGEACMVCLLSHGEEGHIYGTDGRKLELDSVFNLFSNVHCKFLMGKPKIFVIQACRGGALDSGVQLENIDEHDGSSMAFKQLPSLSDMIICFPTQGGYYAWRNRERGSWYIEAFVQIFMKYARFEDICTMLNRVNLLVSRKVSRCPQVEMDSMSQMSEYKSTLRMPHLFFFPGIGSG